MGVVVHDLMQPTAIANKMRVKLCLLFFMLFSLSILAQEDLYIEYNPENGDVYFEGKDRIRFYLRPRIDASYYIYDKKYNGKKYNGKKEVYRDQIVGKLVPKTEANRIAEAIREKRSKELEKETGLKVPTTKIKTLMLFL